MKNNNCPKCSTLKSLYEVELFLKKLSKFKNIFCATKSIKKLQKPH